MHRRAMALSICLTSAAFNWFLSPPAAVAQDVFDTVDLSSEDVDATPPPDSAFVLPGINTTPSNVPARANATAKVNTKATSGAGATIASTSETSATTTEKSATTATPAATNPDSALSITETQQINDLLNRIAGIDRAQKSLENEAPDTIEREKALSYNRKTIQESEQKLAAFGPRAIPLLIEALNRSEKDVSEASARVLLTFGPQIVKPIIVSLTDQTLTAKKGKSVAAGTIEQLGSDANGALRDMLNSGSDAERLATMRLIGDMAPTPPGVHRTTSFGGYYHYNRDTENQWVVPSSLIQPVCNATTDKSESIRRTAVETLGKIGPRNAMLIQTVFRVLKKDPDESVRRTAATALGEIGSMQSSGPAAHTVEMLASTMTGDEYEGARMAAAKAIGRIQQAPNAVKTLVLGLNDPVQMVKDSCITSLQNMGAAAAPAVPELIKCLDTPNTRQAEDVARALARIGPAAAPALPAIIKMARGATTYSSIKYTLADACRNMGPQASSAVPMLIEMLKDQDNKGSQYMAVDALGAIGPAAISAEAALEETLKDPSLKHRSEAALKKIRGQSTSATTVITPGSGGTIIITPQGIMRPGSRPPGSAPGSTTPPGTTTTPGTTAAPGTNASPTTPVVAPRAGDEVI